MVDAIFICLSGTWICAGYRLACARTFSSEGARKVCESTSPVINFWVPPAAMKCISVMPMNPKIVRRYGVTKSMRMGKKQVPRYVCLRQADVQRDLLFPHSHTLCHTVSAHDLWIHGHYGYTLHCCRRDPEIDDRRS